MVSAHPLIAYPNAEHRMHVAIVRSVVAYSRAGVTPSHSSTPLWENDAERWARPSPASGTMSLNGRPTLGNASVTVAEFVASSDRSAANAPLEHTHGRSHGRAAKGVSSPSLFKLAGIRPSSETQRPGDASAGSGGPMVESVVQRMKSRGLQFLMYHLRSTPGSGPQIGSKGRVVAIFDHA